MCIFFNRSCRIYKYTVNICVVAALGLSQSRTFNLRESRITRFDNAVAKLLTGKHLQDSFVDDTSRNIPTGPISLAGALKSI